MLDSVPNNDPIIPTQSLTIQIGDREPLDISYEDDDITTTLGQRLRAHILRISELPQEVLTADSDTITLRAVLENGDVVTETMDVVALQEWYKQVQDMEFLPAVNSQLTRVVSDVEKPEFLGAEFFFSKQPDGTYIALVNRAILRGIPDGFFSEVNAVVSQVQSINGLSVVTPGRSDDVTFFVSPDAESLYSTADIKVRLPAWLKSGGTQTSLPLGTSIYLYKRIHLQFPNQLLIVYKFMSETILMKEMEATLQFMITLKDQVHFQSKLVTEPNVLMK
ncbi:MAG: hypothetical protein ACOCXT_05465 [Candidatus Dojkabacteria bacterium]